MVLNTSESQATWIKGMSFKQILKYFQYPLFWLLTCGGPTGHTVDLNPEFLLGTKIAHVWEDNESLVISICGLEVPERGSYKKAIKTGHPVYAVTKWNYSDTYKIKGD